ncbi:Xaa-Pro peptidase family protein [Agrobacterium tumefaciens]|uniref:M24 family metallopeptidase n=1 Tax=Agrobacterium tumefaciens TaxID=358 RepID=UPI0022443B71|nr:Xaa-Pro peptidase family protein [Agrobacterium tumefaciens]MCW8143071.1 Xaa-Pro peptidase family protein [Agrobacterium tumefaciens]
MYIFDHKKRIARYQESLKATGIGTAIVMLPANIRYLTGFWGYAARAEYFEPRRLVCVAIPQQGQPLLVVPKIERTFAQAAVDGLDLRIEHHCEITLERERKDAWGIVRDFIIQAGLQNEPVSVEKADLTHRAYQALENGLDGLQLVESNKEVERHRAVKDAMEVKVHRASGHLAAQMFDVEVAAIKEGGHREYEVAMKGWAHNVKACAACIQSETPNQHQVDSPIGMSAQLLTSGSRLNRAHGTASTRMIEPKDVVAIDFCRVPFLLGFRTGFGRVVSQRPLTSMEEDINAAVKKAYDAALDMCRPGAVASEINQVVTDTLVDAGLGPYIVHTCGRTFGVETEMKLAEGSTGVLEADMIVSIEPSVYMDGYQSRIESTFRITDDKPELLTPVHEGVIRL